MVLACSWGLLDYSLEVFLYTAHCRVRTALRAFGLLLVDTIKGASGGSGEFTRGLSLWVAGSGCWVLGAPWCG